MSEPYARNCRFCVHLGSDDGGSDYPSHSWPICTVNGLDENPRANLKSFPFKKEQSCHVPDFWLVLEADAELKALFDGNNLDVVHKRFEEKYDPPEGRSTDG